MIPRAAKVIVDFDICRISCLWTFWWRGGGEEWSHQWLGRFSFLQTAESAPKATFDIRPNHHSQEVVLCGRRTDYDRVAAGYFLFLIYGRLRYSDAFFVFSFKIEGLKVHILKGRWKRPRRQSLLNERLDTFLYLSLLKR